MQRLVKELYKILNEVRSEETPNGLQVPASFSGLVEEMASNHYDTKTFAVRLKAMVRLLTLLCISDIHLL